MYSVLVFVLGLVLGSFISAFTYRYPRRIQFLTGRSFCDHCKKKISWFDNISLLSFLVLGGKCRNCHKKISFRYPAIELVSGLGALCLYLVSGFPLFIIHYSLFVILLCIFVIDLEHQIIPDELIFLGLIFALFIIHDSLFGNLLAGFFTASVLLLIHLVTRGRGMGLGDVKFAVLGGMIVGLKLSLVWILLAFLTGGMAGVILVLAQKAKLKSKIAFGPFLVFSILLTRMYGEKILTWLHFN